MPITLPDPVVTDTLGWLFGVRAYLDELDRALPDIKRREIDSLDSLARSEDWDEWAYEARRGDIEIRLERWVPRLVGYSLVVFLYTAIETQLLALSNRMRELKSTPIGPGDLKGDAVERAKLFLARLAGLNVAQDQSWQVLQDIERLRHHVVHYSGQQGPDTFRQKALQSVLARYKPDLTLSGAPELAESELVISLELCRRFVDETEAFFTRAFKAAGLRFGGPTIACS